MDERSRHRAIVACLYTFATVIGVGVWAHRLGPSPFLAVTEQLTPNHAGPVGGSDIDPRFTGPHKHADRDKTRACTPADDGPGGLGAGKRQEVWPPPPTQPTRVLDPESDSSSPVSLYAAYEGLARYEKRGVLDRVLTGTWATWSDYLLVADACQCTGRARDRDLALQHLLVLVVNHCQDEEAAVRQLVRLSDDGPVSKETAYRLLQMVGHQVRGHSARDLAADVADRCAAETYAREFAIALDKRVCELTPGDFVRAAEAAASAAEWRLVARLTATLCELFPACDETGYVLYLRGSALLSLGERGRARRYLTQSLGLRGRSAYYESARLLLDAIASGSRVY